MPRPLTTIRLAKREGRIAGDAVLRTGCWIGLGLVVAPSTEASAATPGPKEKSNGVCTSPTRRNAAPRTTRRAGSVVDRSTLPPLTRVCLYGPPEGEMAAEAGR